MPAKELIKSICRKLGENNKPTYVVMSIAAVKGVCRPMFTLMDKSEDKETKRYTALREGLTELIAIPAYWGCGELAAKFAKKMFKDNDLVHKAEKNLMFLGVCTAAIFVIPALCSVAIKPVMEKMGLKSNSNKNNTLPVDFDIVKHTPQTFGNSPICSAGNRKTLYNTYSHNYSGMRIGGI